MTSEMALTLEEVDQLVAYDPETGSLTWKVDVARNIKAGSPAGSMKTIRVDSRTGLPVRYRYITIQRYSFPAARVAWLLSYREWPKTNVVFIDGNSENLRLDNLGKATFALEDRISNGARQRLISRDASRHYQLKSYYGITLEEYGQKLADQGGVCAICGEPEVRITPKGDLTTLHVDHDHETNEVRSLLCYRCNNALGAMRDRPDLLRKAADYIERHRANRGT